MKNEHIIELIEKTPLANITESEVVRAQAHAGVCASCKRALEAAQISTLLLKEHAVDGFEPSPFFQTRVLAALRERQAGSEQWSWGRLWRTAGTMASAMVASVAAFAVLTFVIPGVPNDAERTSAANSYSAEEVILDRGVAEYQAEEQPSDAQVLKALYETEEEK